MNEKSLKNNELKKQISDMVDEAQTFENTRKILDEYYTQKIILKKSYILENVIESFLVELSKNLGIRCDKWEASEEIGVPDRIITTGKLTFFAECKTRGGKIRKKQVQFKKSISKLGGNVSLIYTPQEASNFLKNCLFLEQKFSDFLKNEVNEK